MFFFLNNLGENEKEIYFKLQYFERKIIAV